MLKNLEMDISRQASPLALQAEFAQHDFEKLRNFCRLTYIASIGIWLLFDLIISFKGGQGFSGFSILFLVIMCALTIALGFVHKPRHFDLLNLLFVLAITVAIRLITFGLELNSQPIWLALASSTVLYSASVLPLSRGGFLATFGVTWVTLNPFLLTGLSLLDLNASLLLSYMIFLSGLTLYCFFTLRRVKLYNYTLSRLLLNQAYIDALTDIPNRRSFMSSANHKRLASPGAPDHYLAMIDIDNFKQVNDHYGHDIGDEVLKRIATDIKAVMSDHNYARLGGEEFAVYLTGVQRQQAESLAERLVARVHNPDNPYPVSVSVGLTQVETDAPLNQALINADLALYEAKHHGKDRFVFYSPA